uniref:ORF HJ2 n=2 Tax=Murid herpesvirus 1 TaxID=10366 RepID=Q83146_MUHV1|nr:ORF HJ2 [Murid betaherpesvirus 1]
MSPPLLFTISLFFALGSRPLAGYSNLAVWYSDYENGTYSCEFVLPRPNNMPLPFTNCYLPEKIKSSATVTPNGTILLHDNYLTTKLVEDSSTGKRHRRLSFRDPEFEKRHPCLYCERPGDSMDMERCLMCKDTTMAVLLKDLHTPKRRDFSPMLVRATVETVNHRPYFTCRFRVTPDTQKIETAWLNDDCTFGAKTKDPIEACAKTASYKKSIREGRYVTMSAKVKPGDPRTCRVCLLKTDNKYVLMARPCLTDKRHQEYIRNVRIVHALVISVWAVAIALVGFAAVRLLLSLDSVARLVKKMFAVRILPLPLPLVVVWYVLAAGDTVAVTDRDGVLAVESVLLSGLELGFNHRSLNASQMKLALER